MNKNGERLNCDLQSIKYIYTFQMCSYHLDLPYQSAAIKLIIQHKVSLLLIIDWRLIGNKINTLHSLTLI